MCILLTTYLNINLSTYYLSDVKAHVSKGCPKRKHRYLRLRLDKKNSRIITLHSLKLAAAINKDAAESFATLASKNLI